MKIDPKFVAKKIELAKKYLGETRELFKADDYDILHSSGNSSFRSNFKTL